MSKARLPGTHRGYWTRKEETIREERARFHKERCEKWGSGRPDLDPLTEHPPEFHINVPLPDDVSISKMKTLDDVFEPVHRGQVWRDEGLPEFANVTRIDAEEALQRHRARLDEELAKIQDELDLLSEEPEEEVEEEEDTDIWGSSSLKDWVLQKLGL